MRVSLVQLCRVMPRLKPVRAQAFLEPLNAAMEEFEINTPARAAAFLAQLAHESCQLRYFEEHADGSAYEGRRSLGNIQPGDGPRFKGRGPIQLTGRKNYTRCASMLGLPLVEHPELAASPTHGFRIAGWFWVTRGLNYLADQGDFTAITKAVNGGLNGFGDRLGFWNRAKAVLGVS